MKYYKVPEGRMLSTVVRVPEDAIEFIDLEGFTEITKEEYKEVLRSEGQEVFDDLDMMEEGFNGEDGIKP